MNILDELNAIRVERIRVNRLGENIERMRSTLERATAASDRNGGRSTVETDPMSARVAELIDLEAEWFDSMLAIEKRSIVAEGCLGCLTSQQREVVHWRYIEGMGWEEVSRRTHYSRRHCFNIRDRAVDRLKKKAEKDEQVCTLLHSNP